MSKIRLCIYKWITIQMALRHPDALIYTKNFINTGFMKNIDKDINDYLYKNFGLDFSYLDYVDINGEPQEVIKYVHDISHFKYISISCIPQYETFLNNEIEKKPKEKVYAQLPTKLLPKGHEKGGIMLKSINKKLFRWYDAFYKISNETPYKIDPTTNETKDAKRKCDILHLCIINKQWDELLIN